VTRTIIDLHVVQTVPPSNLNRDDTGSPKKARYGGVERARVSSQAWKRAMRRHFATVLDMSDLGVRTKRVVEALAEAIKKRDPGAAESAEAMAKQVLTAAGIKTALPRGKKEVPEESGYLLFLSRQQISRLAELAVEAKAQPAVDKRDAQAVLKGKNSIDLALFGRMVADVTDLNVDASAQVAHALSTHAVDTEFDYFTAVDDHKAEDVEEDAGAGMIGTVEFNSSTLYRYATVDVDLLRQNLGDDEATVRAVRAFVDAFVRSMPTGKQNTFANRTLPDAVVVAVRDDQPVSWVGAFEAPVLAAASEGRVAASIDRLAAYAKDLSDAYALEADHTWVVGVGGRAAGLDAIGERVSLDALVEAVPVTVARRLTEQP
jgi:CRISPR system Cascade subunit CasC